MEIIKTLYQGDKRYIDSRSKGGGGRGRVGRYVVYMVLKRERHKMDERKRKSKGDKRGRN